MRVVKAPPSAAFELGLHLFMLNCDMGAMKSGVTFVEACNEKRMAKIVPFTVLRS
jgi:hypothetical protein